MPRDRQGQAVELTKSAQGSGSPALPARVPGWLVGRLRLGVGHASTVRPDPSTLGAVGERGSHREDCSQSIPGLDAASLMLDVGVTAASGYRLLGEFVQRTAADPWPMGAASADQVDPPSPCYKSIGSALWPVRTGNLAPVMFHSLLSVLPSHSLTFERHQPPLAKTARAARQRWGGRAKVTGAWVAPHDDFDDGAS
jgi:hypothetical protein